MALIPEPSDPCWAGFALAAWRSFCQQVGKHNLQSQAACLLLQCSCSLRSMVVCCVWGSAQSTQHPKTGRTQEALGLAVQCDSVPEDR